MAKIQVTINGISGEVEEGTSVLDAAKQMGARMAHYCFGNALCTTCRFDCISGAESLSEKSPKEIVSLNFHLSFDEGTRLGCQAKIMGPGPVDISVPKLFKFIAPPASKSSKQV